MNSVFLYTCALHILCMQMHNPPTYLVRLGSWPSFVPARNQYAQNCWQGGDHAHHTQTVLFLIFLRYAKMPSYNTLLTTHPLIPSQTNLTSWFTFSFTLQHLTYLTRCLFILTEIEALHSEFKLPAVGTPVSVIRCYRSSAYSGAWHGLGGQQVVLNE